MWGFGVLGGYHLWNKEAAKQMDISSMKVTANLHHYFIEHKAFIADMRTAKIDDYTVNAISLAKAFATDHKRYFVLVTNDQKSLNEKAQASQLKLPPILFRPNDDIFQSNKFTNHKDPSHISNSLNPDRHEMVNFSSFQQLEKFCKEWKK